ncbi:MAG: ATP-binding protein [Nitrolancea sp.]
MARADLLKKLFQSYQQRDDQAFQDAAQQIIDEERRKHHPVVANELQRTLKTDLMNHDQYTQDTTLGPLPKDNDRQAPLVHIQYPQRYLQDLVLDEQIRHHLNRIITEFREWEVLEANGLTPVRRILFCGPSGCGKTATAQALASELALPLLYVRFDAVVSSLLGETAANLRKVFEFACRGQWVMFFDEFDAIGRSRDDPTEHGEIKRVVNSFLQILDSFNGRSLAIAATNFERSLDPAIWRRFDEIVRFEKPSPAQIQILIRHHLASSRITEDGIDKLAAQLTGSTHADVERTTLDIRRSVAIRGIATILDEDISDAIERLNYRRSIMKQVDDTPHMVDKE